MKDIFNPLAMLWSITLAAIVYIAVNQSHAAAAVEKLAPLPERVTAIETTLPTLIAVQMATLNSFRQSNGLPPTTPEAVLAGDAPLTKDTR